MLSRFLYYRSAYLSLRPQFRNWIALSRAHLLRRPIGNATLRSGHQLSHHSDQRGLADAVVEIWGMGAYAKGTRGCPPQGTS